MSKHKAKVLKGRKISNRHSTYIAEAGTVIVAAKALPAVSRVVLSEIKRTHAAPRAIKIDPVPAGLRVSVRGRTAVQRLYVYTAAGDRDQVTGVLHAIFNAEYGEPVGSLADLETEMRLVARGAVRRSFPSPGQTDYDRAAKIMALAPMIPWCEPIKVSLTDGRSGYACRICIALHGLKGADIPSLPAEPAPVEAHIREAHPQH